MDMGIFSPGGGLYQYRSTCSAMIRSRVTQAGGGTRSTTAQYHPFIQCQASRWSRGSDTSSRSTSLPASSVLRLRSPINISFIARPNLQIISWSLAGSWRAETLLSASLHVVAEIHTFLRTSLALGFGKTLYRAAKIPSSFVRVVGGRRGGRLLLPRYLECYLRADLKRHPRTK